MRGKQIKNLVPAATACDHTRQGLGVDFDPERKFDRWMDDQLEQLVGRWGRMYPAVEYDAKTGMLKLR